MKTMLMREALGETLRELRTTSGQTLRDISSAARVSLGYLSEVERGQKEASSELLHAICGALNVDLPDVLRRVSDRMETAAVVTPLPLRQPRAAA
ncbi:MAG: helix-turn-helix domain-containing protein [Propioniciclava sp.]